MTTLPVFLLVHSFHAYRQVKVRGKVTLGSATPAEGSRVKVTGRVAPQVQGVGAHLELWAAHPGHALHLVASAKPADGATSYARVFASGKGTWRVKVRYTHPGLVLPASSSALSVHVADLACRHSVDAVRPSPSWRRPPLRRWCRRHRRTPTR